MKRLYLNDWQPPRREMKIHWKWHNLIIEIWLQSNKPEVYRSQIATSNPLETLACHLMRAQKVYLP